MASSSCAENLGQRRFGSPVRDMGNESDALGRVDLNRTRTGLSLGLSKDFEPPKLVP